MRCAIVVDIPDLLIRQNRRRSRGRVFLTSRRGNSLIGFVRLFRFGRREPVQKKPPSLPQPTPSFASADFNGFFLRPGEVATGLEWEILRLAWERKSDGIESSELHQILNDRFEDHRISNAVRELFASRKLMQVRITNKHNPWPPMRIFHIEYSPLHNI